jgi:hypothetical protein
MRTWVIVRVKRLKPQQVQRLRHRLVIGRENVA